MTGIRNGKIVVKVTIQSTFWYVASQLIYCWLIYAIYLGIIKAVDTLSASTSLASILSATTQFLFQNKCLARVHFSVNTMPWSYSN